VGGELADASSDFDSVQGWEAQIEQNQVGVQFFSLLNAFEAVDCFADDLQFGFFPQCGTDESAKRNLILYDQNPEN